MLRRSLAFLIASLIVASVNGCAADTTEEIAPVDEATADLVSVNKLVGSYGEGQGRYASLVFSQKTEAGRKVNRYEGKQVVQCVRAPCPTADVSGKWFARSNTLTLYPEGQPRETYKANVDGNKLTLDNAQGVRVGELTKVVAAPSDVATALQKHGVPNMSSEIEAAEITRQANAAGVTVSFADALDKALDLFLTDEGGLSSTTSEFADDLREECGANADLVKCLANAPRTTISLQKLGDTSAPQGEDPKDAWIFTFFVGDFTDHGYFAVINKKGTEAPYVYAFN